MPRRVRYHSLFDCDVREAADWYDGRAQGLGDDFIACAKVCVDGVISAPERSALLPSGVRYARVKRFPYLVLFDFDDDELLMLGVIHAARDVDSWRRLRD